MYLKKIVGSTVEKLTLSYTEKHLKEALDQEHVIPTPILSIIAEKSFNEYNMKSIAGFLDKAFKIDYKEWRKLRNLLKIIDYLLKFGSNEFVVLAKQHSSNIRSLQNYSFSEAGADRGAGIRESALAILQLLNNSRELDYIREESKRHRDRFTGISSNPSDNPTSGYSSYSNSSYSAPGSGSGSGYSAYGGSGQVQSGFDYKSGKNEGLIYNESQKKFAESIFGASGKNESGDYRGPEVKQDLFAREPQRVTDNRAETGQTRAGSMPNDIFAASNNRETRKPDLFGNVTLDYENRKNEGFEAKGQNDLFGNNLKQGFNGFDPQAKQDIFAPAVEVREQRAGKTVDLFANVNRKDGKVTRVEENLLSGSSGFENKVETGPAGYNLFEVSKKQTAQIDLFEVSSNEKHDVLESVSKTQDLFANTTLKVNHPNPTTQSSSKSDIFMFSDPPSQAASLLPGQVPLTSSQPKQSLPSVSFPSFPQSSASIQSPPSIFPSNPPNPSSQSNPSSLSTLSFTSMPAAQPSGFFPSTQVVNPSSISAPAPAPAPTSNSIFSGMVQKRSFDSTPAEAKPSSFPSFGLEGLNLNVNLHESGQVRPSGPSGPSGLSGLSGLSGASGSGVKVKSNLVQTEEKSKPEAVKKSFNPSEFEEKLFSLDLK